MFGFNPAGPIGSEQRNGELKPHNFKIGEKYYIKTVTFHYLARVKEICDMCVVCDNITWVADSGRLNLAMKGEWDSNSEHEPYPSEIEKQIFYGAILDATEWNHQLITVTK